HGPRSSGPARPPPPARQLPQAQKKKMESDASFIPQLPVQESYAERIDENEKYVQCLRRRVAFSSWQRTTYFEISRPQSNFKFRISDLSCRNRPISNFLLHHPSWIHSDRWRSEYP